MRLTVTTDTARIIASLEKKLAIARAENAFLRKELYEKRPKPKPPDCMDIVKAVAEKYGISDAVIFGLDRSRLSALARQECYTIARKRGMTLERIGQIFSRDHTTIMDGIRAHEARVAKQSVSG